MTTTDFTHISPPARLACFGAAPTPAKLDIVVRPASWRTTRALMAAGIGVGLAPLVAIIPPHVPWAAASLIGGGVIARNRLREHHTLMSIRGTCPRCEGEIEQEPARRLGAVQSIQCGNCGESVLLEVDLPAVPGG